jgi:hypothetical protein
MIEINSAPVAHHSEKKEDSGVDTKVLFCVKRQKDSNFYLGAGMFGGINHFQTRRRSPRWHPNVEVACFWRGM